MKKDKKSILKDAVKKAAVKHEAKESKEYEKKEESEMDEKDAEGGSAFKKLKNKKSALGFKNLMKKA